MTGQAGDAAIKGYARRAYLLAVAANYFGVAILVWYAMFAIRVYPDDRSPGRIILELLVPMVPFLVAVTIHAYFRIRRLVREATLWFVEDRPATTPERRELCRLPIRLAHNSMFYWATGALLAFPYLALVVQFRTGAGGMIRFVVGWVLISIIPWSLTFLLTELAIRPLLSSALEHGELPKSMGIPGRLLLAWVATSGIPTAGVVMLMAGQNADQLIRAVPAMFTILALGTISGITIAVFAGTAILDPIRKVHSALRDVEAGNLDVSIPVSDASELGELQVGVNRMVLGLRERERMRDLFGRHVGAEVAARALASETGLGGDRREATAMFVDVIGSSYLVDREDPDEVVVILNDFFATVVRVITSEGGIVNKFEGDGALCIFGVPIEQPDHAERALRAGQRLQDELSALPGDVGAAIGISSGVVVAGNIGAADRYEYTVIGSPVHEASRLCDEAKLTSARILASESAIRSAGANDTGWVAADTVLLRGRSEMTATYAPLQK